MALQLKQTGDLTSVTDAELIPGGEKDTSYQIRHITIEKYRDIIKKHTKRVPNRRTHQMDEEVDGLAVNDEQFEYALASWSGITNGDGQTPLECTPENKALLDPQRRQAILDRAGANDATAVVDDPSFRRAAAER